MSDNQKKNYWHYCFTTEGSMFRNQFRPSSPYLSRSMREAINVMMQKNSNKASKVIRRPIINDYKYSQLMYLNNIKAQLKNSKIHLLKRKKGLLP